MVLYFLKSNEARMSKKCKYKEKKKEEETMKALINKH